MPNTTTWGITYPDSTSNLTPLESHFQNVATTTDTALTTLKSNIRGANTTDTVASLATAIASVNTRLALNLQTSGAAPAGAPTNSGLEGSMHWDSANNVLYIYDNVAGWQKVWSDTGWQNITVNATFAAGGAAPQYRIVGNVIHLRGSFAATGITAAGTSYNVGQLPAAAYPQSGINYVGATSSSDTTKASKITISTGGVLTITTGSVTGGVPSYFINFSYMLG